MGLPRGQQLCTQSPKASKKKLGTQDQQFQGSLYSPRV